MKNGNQRENKCSGKYFAYIISSDAVHILWICAHAYAVRQVKVLDDNEWGWLDAVD